MGDLRWFLALVVVLAAGAAAEEAPINGAELEALKSAQATVAQAQKDLDGLDQNRADATATGNAEDAFPTDKGGEKKEHPDMGEALMAADDKMVDLPEDTDADVQAEALANNVLQEGAVEGEERADPKDITKVYDLANNLKPTDLLPEGWAEKVDQSTGKPYYENMATKTTSWDPPRSLVGIALAAAKGQQKLQEELRTMRMKMSTQRDLGESASTATRNAQCPKKLKAMFASANELQGVIKNLAAKLNLTGEQGQLLAKLMKSIKLPKVTQADIQPPAAKPNSVFAKERAMKNSAKKQPPAKTPPKVVPPKAKKKASGGKPIELGEEEALEDQQDKTDSLAVEIALKNEAAKVASRFEARQKVETSQIAKAEAEAAKKINDKMKKEDAALMASDKDTDARVSNIIGDRKRFQAEQALYTGTMTPAQVYAQLSDKADVDNDFAPVKKSVAKAPPKAVPATQEELDEEFMAV